MRFNEIANAQDQLELWRLISDNVWAAVMAQAKEEARLKAQAAATPRYKKIKPKKGGSLDSWPEAGGDEEVETFNLGKKS